MKLIFNAHVIQKNAKHGAAKVSSLIYKYLQSKVNTCGFMVTIQIGKDESVFLYTPNVRLLRKIINALSSENQKDRRFALVSIVKVETLSDFAKKDSFINNDTDTADYENK